MIAENTTLTFTFIIALVTVGCTLYNTFHNKRNHDETGEEKHIKEITTRAVEMAKIESKLDQISADVRYIRDDVTGTKKEIRELDKRVALLDASIRSAHKRMDGAGIGKAEPELRKDD
ncbi:hypothetical protein [uncultured Robinsoniella sp.]|uniref:hypothetical protein n=1 Tax=uncultured Robinsoniella sp. TaxID=904190 RepID=UPI00374F1987